MPPLDVTWNPYEADDIIVKEAIEIYNNLIIAVLDPLKDAYRQYNRGIPNQLLEPDYINQILIKEEDFIKLYINVFKQI